MVRLEDWFEGAGARVHHTGTTQEKGGDMMQLSECTIRLLAIEKIIKDHPKSFTQKFLTWMQYNLYIWEEFESRSLKLVALNRVRFCARAILDYMRWDVPTKAGENVRKGVSVPNDVSPYFARLWDIVHPESKGFFIQRELKNKTLSEDL